MVAVALRPEGWVAMMVTVLWCWLWWYLILSGGLNLIRKYRGVHGGHQS